MTSGYFHEWFDPILEGVKKWAANAFSPKNK
jgi:hypothetical protein